MGLYCLGRLIDFTSHNTSIVLFFFKHKHCGGFSLPSPSLLLPKEPKVIQLKASRSVTKNPWMEYISVKEGKKKERRRIKDRREEGRTPLWDQQ